MKDSSLEKKKDPLKKTRLFIAMDFAGGDSFYPLTCNGTLTEAAEAEADMLLQPPSSKAHKAASCSLRFNRAPNRIPLLLFFFFYIEAVEEKLALCRHLPSSIESLFSFRDTRWKNNVRSEFEIFYRSVFSSSC